jgi:type VI secretion system protein ImpA
MPLPPALLEPIPGPSPGGENLYYSPVFEKIKEARRQEEEIAQGEWRHDVKKADYPQVIKLATEALTQKSKDLQLAVWLTEAWLNQQGVGGLADGLDLMRGLVGNFWDSLFPELEDGDAEMRATPLEWVGSRLGDAVKHAPLTRGGLDWFGYKVSRSVPYETETAENESKAKTREAAVADGKLTPEEFDEAFAATSVETAAAFQQNCDRALESLESLGQVCNEKFGDAAPNFGPLRTSLEEVRQTLRILLAKRGAPAQEEAPAAEEWAPAEETGGEAPAARAAAPARKIATAEPADPADAFERVIQLAGYLRKESPYSPVPYLLLRGLRWGELRANGASLDESSLEAPPTEFRQKLKRLAQESQWEEVLGTAEAAMGLPCGRGWLDLQRYVVRACENLGSWYDPIALALRAEVRALLQDFPQLPSLTLSDDTPTANPETQAWLGEMAAPSSTEETPGPARPARAEPEEAAGVPDAYDLAMEAMRARRPQDAIEILSQEIAQVRSGRMRFQRKVQLAQVCMASGHAAIAHPILEELAREVEHRNLEEWEAPDMLAHPLVLLLKSMNAMDGKPEDKQKVYARICRLDPIQALNVNK